MKIVLDTNVFISGIFWKGLPHQIVKLAEQNKIQIYTTLEILQELFGVLKRKKFNYLFEKAKTSREETFQGILKLVKTCISQFKVKVIESDPPDNNVLSCAVSCGASFIISGDRHLLKLKEFQGIPIITPRTFIQRFLKYDT